MTVAEPTIAQTFALLDGHQYMNLTTYRKNGTEVTRPVWFAKDGDKLYLMTQNDSGKVKHIRRNGEVFVSPSDARGTPLTEERVAGMATIHEKGTATATHANALLNKKYGLFKALFSVMYLFRRTEVVWIEVVLR